MSTLVVVGGGRLCHVCVCHSVYVRTFSVVSECLQAGVYLYK